MGKTTSRYNVYACIHKGIRRELGELLRVAAHTDFADADERERYLARMRASVALMNAHADHEDHHVEPLLEQFAPALARRIAATHAVLAEQEHEVLALADRVDGPASGHALYLALTRYAATQYGHMAEEESEVINALWANMSDAALVAVEHAIVESCTPEQNATYIAWMMHGVSEPERAAMLAGMRGGAPAEVVAFAEGLAEAARREQQAA